MKLECYIQHVLHAPTIYIYFFYRCIYIVIHIYTTIIHRVIESKCADFAVGDLIVARYGWQTHTISDAAQAKDKQYRISKIDPTIPLSPSTALGTLGMPG